MGSVWTVENKKAYFMSCSFRNWAVMGEKNLQGLEAKSGQGESFLGYIGIITGTLVSV